ncbi:hypothetical protein [Saccharomonospora viridis]|uniref:hypothetical protein n=1 Tax=Saccharomonospora viridis TaxID=1852 RepID=UPI00240976CC|nr:hypothetical protein [Saccharomonospora viridis]
MRTLTVLVLLLLAGCAVPGGGERHSPQDGPRAEVYAPAGVSVDIAPGLDAGSVALEVCWDGRCHPVDVELHPATTVDPSPCEGTDPDDVCSAQVRETGGFHGFTELPELPEEPVRVTLTVFDEAGEKLVHHTVESTPQPVHPNGSDGDSAGPQLRLDVAADGSVTPRG